MGLFTLLFEFIPGIIFIASILYLGLEKKDYRSVAQILTGGAFGLIMEYVNIVVFASYEYSSDFIFQIGNNIPIIPGLFWGMVIFACMNVSDKFELPEWSRPIFDGLLYLTTNLVVDPIAIRLDGGLWTWFGVELLAIPTTSTFFGVNYGNFVGSIIVVLCFSMLLRFEKRILDEKMNVPTTIRVLYFCLIPITNYILLIGFMLVAALIFALLRGLPLGNLNPANIAQVDFLFLLILISITGLVIQLVLIYKCGLNIEKDVSIISMAVFGFLFGFFISAYLLTGLFIEVPLILVESVIFIVLDFIIFWKITDINKIKEYLSRVFGVK